MCGNFNGDPADDRVFPNGTLAPNDNEFGHKLEGTHKPTKLSHTPVNIWTAQNTSGVVRRTVFTAASVMNTTIGPTSNGTHFIYENTIQGDVDPSEGLISRQRNIHLLFSCEYPLTQALSMEVGINPVER
ncbi:hypothetical protein LDENG_00100480 [Lucifuga dentata]|nr:hypothetical protein LDENG_00100480 [Lucifuga dentata]